MVPTLKTLKLFKITIACAIMDTLNEIFQKEIFMWPSNDTLVQVVK